MTGIYGSLSICLYAAGAALLTAAAVVGIVFACRRLRRRRDRCRAANDK